MNKRIYLSSPHMSDEGYEQQYIKEAFDTNWIAPLGENVNKFEEELSTYVGVKSAAALSSGTAAIHMALKAIDIKTMPYPGFPTDMQSIFGAMLCTAKGTSMIIENIFENRYKYVNELIKMGAKITVEGKICIIKGTRRLYGANVDATDLRGGASLVVAALNAKGTTIVNNAKYILRGYENLDKKLNSLGAKIELKNI